MRPFVLLSSRAEDLAAEEEYAAFLRVGGLAEAELVRVRMEAGPFLDAVLGRLEEWSGLVMGGSPYCTSDAAPDKSATQHRVERELAALLDVVVAHDVPLLGACYGIGTLGVHQGGVVDRHYAEPISAVPVTLTDAGRSDPLCAGLSTTFEAFVGHKEACRVLPPNATLLAGSPDCPVQMFRVRQNLYATQFHPELDVPGILTRVEVYQHAGYFAPEEKAGLSARLRTAEVDEPGRVMRNFVVRYAR